MNLISKYIFILLFVSSGCKSPVQNDIILNGQDSELFDVSYYLSEDDALNSNNPLDPIIENSSNPQTIYARVESNQAYDCYSITSFNLAVCQIPDGISPNGDGYNDSFILNGYNVNTLHIYNRYGKLVYSTNNYNSFIWMLNFK